VSTTVAISDGDFFFTPNGQLLLITETTKGEQDFCEEFLTEYIPDEDYGNDIFSLVGGNGDLVNGGVEHALEAVTSQKAKDVVTRLQAQQQSDLNSTPEERIGGISTLIVQTDPANHLNGEIIGDKTGFVVSTRQAEPSQKVELDALLVSTPQNSS
jgi:hypothetical protein